MEYPRQSPPIEIRLHTQVDLYEPNWDSEDPPLVHRCSVTDYGPGWFDCRLGMGQPLHGPLWDVHPGFHVYLNSDGDWGCEVRGEVWDAYVLNP